MKTIFDVKADLTVSLPLNKDDSRYLLEVFRTSLSISKILEGFRGNFWTKPLLDGIISAIDFELVFPFKSGMYKINNWTMPGKFAPSMLKIKIPRTS